MQGPCLLAATRRVEFLDKRKFAAAAFDQDDEMVGVYELLSMGADANAEALPTTQRAGPQTSSVLVDHCTDFAHASAPKFTALFFQIHTIFQAPWSKVYELLDRSIV